MGVLGLGAIAAYVKLTPADRIPESLRSQPKTPGHSTKDKDHVDVVKPKANGPELTFNHGDVDVPEGGDAVLTAVNGFLDHCPFVPKDARALSAAIKDRIARIDFSNSFERTYGTTDEAALLQGLQHAMGQFKDVDKVILCVSGKPLDSLGNVEIVDGFTVIRPDGSEPAKPAEGQP